MATVSHLRPADFPVSRLPAVDVSQVPQRSPLRYPGGKTWLIPHIREWLRQVQPTLLVEPFAGGGRRVHSGAAWLRAAFRCSILWPWSLGCSHGPVWAA